MPLLQQAESYAVILDGQKVPVPYWINWDLSPYFLNAPYRGKGTPGQLQRAATRAWNQTASKFRPDTVEGKRQWLKRRGLGVDCSGFAYWSLRKFLQPRHVDLAEHLLVDASEIEEALKRHPERSVPAPTSPVTTLRQVARAWHKDPVMITPVARLCDQRIARRIDVATDVLPGDLIRMTSASGDHIAIVTATSADTITYEASEDSSTDLGGVRTRIINVLDPCKGIDRAQWEQRNIFNPANGKDGIWRLKLLDELDSRR